MNATQFLEFVWPDDGPYCVAWPAKRRDNGDVYFKHKAFDTAPEAARFATMSAAADDMYYGIHALKVDYQKTDRGHPIRKSWNLRGARVMFYDLDCGVDLKTGKPKDYPTKDAARLELVRVCREIGLPLPLMVSSGYGVHVYWRLADEMDAETWKRVADMMQALAEHHGLKVDRKCTTDVARVLRVVGTFNHKDPENLKKVELRYGPTETIPNADFIAILEKAMAALPPPEVREIMELPEAGKPTEADVRKVCPTFRLMEDEASKAPGVIWMATNTLALHIKDGQTLAHRLAAEHPQYKQTETQGKLDRLLELKMGPTTCGKLEELYGAESPCKTCAYYGAPKSSPVVFARRLPKSDLPEGVPDPQLPFSRTSRGVSYQGPTVSGVTPPLQTISPYDMYPSMIVNDLIHETKRITWNAETRPKEWTQFRLDAGIYHDEPRLLTALANQGVIIEKRNAKRMGEYMSHYIRLLQQHAADHAQHESFGWVMPERKSFVHGRTVISPEGTRPAVLANGLQNLEAAMYTGGTLEGQIKSLTFYDKPRYVRQQFIVLSSLGAALLYMTGYTGVIVNIWGESGASKSTALVAGASFWGLARKLIMDGNEQGATKNGRAGRVRMLASIPVIIDEITLMPPEDIRAIAMAITQEGDRIVKRRDGTEKTISDTGKATTMICSSNSSTHELMSVNSPAGTATAMRVMEIHESKQFQNTKDEADAALREFRTHFGHIGPLFAEFVVRHREAIQKRVDEVMAEINKYIAPEERYWGAAVVAALVALDICRKLKLVTWERKVILNWFIQEQLPQARQSVKTNHPDEVEVIVSYINTIANSVLVVSPDRMKPGHKGPLPWNVTREPKSGALKGRAELIDGHSKIYLAASALKDYCIKSGIPYDATIRVLEHKKVATRVKMDLARNVPTFQGGQVRTICIDLNSELLTGMPPVEVSGETVLHFPGKKVLP